jgi:hypothetical protein
MANKVCVVVSVHSAAPSYYELVSFQQCFKILAKHAVYVIAPHGLDLSAYKNLVPDFKVKFVDKKWQASKLNYNKFKLSQYFYKLFNNYEYLLTYELDAFIFSDELDYWCGKGYDYIGAPWFEEYDAVKGNILRVGNSGFSLRRVQALQQGIRSIYYVDPTRYVSIRNSKFLKKSKKFIFSNLNIIASIRSLFSKENSSIQKATILYEDRVIANGMLRLKNFNIAPVDEAIKFSFEVNPDILYKMNDNTLPMGCHAWWLSDLEFWKPFIENYGYKL